MPAPSKKWFTQAMTNHHSFKAYIEPMVQWLNPAWQSTGHMATVKANRQENDQVFTLVLKPNTSWPSFQAGQHIDLQTTINGRRHHRTFSLSTAPEYHRMTGLIELTIRQQEHGKVTPWLATNLKATDQVVLSPAKGNFTLPEHPFPLLLIAGGSGITPFRSFIQQLSQIRPNQDVHLMFYNQANQPLFAGEWEVLKQLMPKLQVTFIDTAIDGQINQHQIQHHCPDFLDRVAFLCGPHGMITSSRDLLLDLGVNETDIHHELFGPKPMKPLPFNNQAAVFFAQSKVTEQANGTTQRSLLEMAEQAQLNPNSGCRMGVCHQCQCRKLNGVVYNTLTDQYSDSGSEDIQLCISVPATNVTIEL